MFDFIQPYLARLAGAAVGALTAYLAAHFGLTLSGDDQAKLTAGGAVILMTVFQLAYAITHRTVSKVTNPLDTASR